jgi:glucose-6-phosphate isomerase
MELVADLVVPITGTSGRLFELSRAIGCEELLPVADGVSARFAAMSAAGLLPGSLMGIDIVKLLEGAAAMNAHFREGPATANIVLKYAGICHLWETVGQANVRVLALWGNALAGVGYWYDQLVAESLGKDGRGVTPLSVVNTRDLHSRGQQHQEGRRDKLITNVVVDAPRRDKLAVGSSELDEDQLNPLADRALGDLMSAAFKGMKQAYAEERRPTADLRLPKLNELALGQFLQMMMLATVVEARLLGVNPYGQPGVEAYKKHMNELLRKS